MSGAFGWLTVAAHVFSTLNLSPILLVVKHSVSLRASGVASGDLNDLLD